MTNSVHGLGIVVATIVAVTGGAGNFVPQPLALLGGHVVFSTNISAYLIGHAGVAVIHEFSGDRLLRRMFALDKR